MPNREVPLAPMLQDWSSPQIITAAVIDAPVAAAPDVPVEVREVRAGGLLKTLVTLLGGVGAFTLFGGIIERTRAADQREQLERRHRQSA